MAVWRYYEFQPLRSRWNDCIERAIENKKMFERLGVKTRLFTAADGGPYVKMSFIAEYDDWAHLGEVTHKTETDPEYQRLLVEGLSDPVHENFSCRTVTEVPMP